MRSAWLFLALMAMAAAAAPITVGTHDGLAEIRLVAASEQPRLQQEGGGFIEGRIQLDLSLKSERLEYSLLRVENGTIGILEMAEPKLSGQYDAIYTLEGTQGGRCTRSVHEYGSWKDNRYRPMRSTDRLQLTIEPNGQYQLEGNISVEVIIEANESCGGGSSEQKIVTTIRSFDILQIGGYDPEKPQWAGNATPNQTLEFGALETSLTGLSWNYRLGRAAEETPAPEPSPTGDGEQSIPGIDDGLLRKGLLAAVVVIVALFIGNYYFGKKEEF